MNTTECPACEGTGTLFGLDGCCYCDGTGEVAIIRYCATCGNPADEPNYMRFCCTPDNMLEA